MTDVVANRPPVVQKLAIIGCGLIGSSLALAARRGGAAARIVVSDRDPDVRRQCVELGLADQTVAEAAEAVADADLVIIATPVGAFGAVAAAIGPALADGAVLSDVGSVKGHVVDAVRPHLPTDGRRVHFVPAHPVAGTEQSGPAAGFASLFDNRWCILTPLSESTADAAAGIEKLARFWRRLGARISTMSIERHDRVLAMTSHLPHLIAYTIVGTAGDLENLDGDEIMKYSAGGFRDFTRIAASDPVMWRDVFLTNKEAVLELLSRFTEDLIALQRAIRWHEGDKLYAHFQRTRAMRRGILALGQDTAEPDFGRERDRPASAGDGDGDGDGR